MKFTERGGADRDTKTNVQIYKVNIRAINVQKEDKGFDKWKREQ